MQFELSLLAAFGAMLCWGFGDFFIQHSIKRIGDVESLALIGMIGTIGLLPFIAPEIPLLYSEGNLALLLLIGLLTFCIAMLNFEALKRGKLSVVEVILEIELPVTIVLSFMFLRETLSLPQLGIIFFIFIGILLIAVRSFHDHPFKKLEKGVVLGAVTAVGLGVVNLLTAVGSKQVSPLMVIWIPWIIFTSICLVIIWRREGVERFIRNTVRFKGTVLCMGVLDTLAWLLFAVALFHNEVAITTAITESYPAIALFLGVWLNKERIMPHQYAGAFIALVACFILAFTQ